MAEAAVSVALETLGDLLLEEAKFLGGVSSEVRTLEAQLREIKSLLKDAETKRHNSETVRDWVKEIRGLSYRAEDAIELYAAVQGSSMRGRGRRRRRRLKQLLRRCSFILKEGFSLHQIGTEISEIKSEIARVTKSMQDYGIRSIIEGESSAADDENEKWKRRTFPFETEDVFVGKDKELEQLVSLVVDAELFHCGGWLASGKLRLLEKCTITTRRSASLNRSRGFAFLSSVRSDQFWRMC